MAPDGGFGYHGGMKRDDVLAILSSHRPEFELMGVSHAALFGSVARGANTEASDIDILIEVDEAASVGVFEYVGIVQFLQGLFAKPVDVAHKKALKAGLRPEIERDAVYAF